MSYNKILIGINTFRNDWLTSLKKNNKANIIIYDFNNKNIHYIIISKKIDYIIPLSKKDFIIITKYKKYNNHIPFLYMFYYLIFHSSIWRFKCAKM